MLPVPIEEHALLDFALSTIEQCRVSVSSRAAYCRLMNSIAETGRYDGNKALINMMNAHLERVAAHLFSPVELKFALDYENAYPKREMDRAGVVARILTRQWDRAGTGLLFGRGVFEAVKYGACLMKQWPQIEGEDESISYYQKLVMPWQFGVYNEKENDINKQSALCETAMLTMPEIWRRICHLPNAKKLFERIKQHAQSGVATSEQSSFFHQVLSTSQLNTGLSSSEQPMPGGIVQLGNDPNYSLMGPQIAAPVVQFHELWVQDATDYTTIQIVEPDILIAPLFNKANLLGKNIGTHPYRLIQANEVTEWFWGRSELVDLVEPQGFLAQLCEDAKRLIGQEVDKLLGFVGETGMTDELYAQFRAQGWTNMGPGSSITDLTPKMPAELLPMIRFLLEMINTLGSFPEIMQGKGDSGVRAGIHAETLLKTASPTLRDRSLLVEKQCAVHADLTLALMEAKDPRKYWTNGDTTDAMKETAFGLTDLPDDWRVTIDSHSGSPIFANENAQLIFSSHKSGIVDDEYVIDNLPFPNKEAAKQAARDRKKEKSGFLQKMLKDYPDLGEKMVQKQVLGGKH